MLFQVILIASCKMVSAIDITQGKPVPHAEELHRMITANVLNYTDSNKGSFIEYFLNPEGSNNTENLDFKVLDADNLKKIVEMAMRKHNEMAMRRQNETAMRRNTKEYTLYDKMESLKGNHHLIERSLEQMQQSIYATRFRIQSTTHLRQMFGDRTSYKIALLVGSMNQIILKMETHHAQMWRFPRQTHFFWYLVLYEKAVAYHVDVTNIVKQIYQLNSQKENKFTK